MVKVNIGLARKLLVFALVLLIAIPSISTGCQAEVRPPTAPPVPPPSPAIPSSGELSSTLVPNTQLDLYVYTKQDNPTTLPAKTINASQDIDVESLAIWGVPAEDDLAFAIGFTLANASEASNAYDLVSIEGDSWKKLSGNNVYFMPGSDAAAETLKTAISKGDFKHYDDKKALKAVTTLPSGGTTKLAGIFIAKPNEVLINLIVKGIPFEGSGQINIMLQLANIEAIVGGLYPSERMDVAKMLEAIEGDGNFFQLDSSLVILFKCGRPSFLVVPIAKKILVESGYTKTNIGDVTLYKAPWNTDGSGTTPTLLGVEGNHILPQNWSRSPMRRLC